jgi:hypothetical protein
MECQLDFGYLGLLADPVSGRQRKVHALIFTACYSRHMFVWLSFTQTLAAFLAGCEAAWAFFGGYACVDHATAVSERQKWWRSPPWSADGLDAVPGPVCRSRGSGPGPSRRPSGG